MFTAAEVQIGARFGEYEIESLLGVGGMGKVYGARDRDGGRVALKVAKPDYAADETFRRRFRLEAEIASSVRNPHLVGVLDAGEHDGIPFLAAELIEGQSLDEKLQAEGALDVATTVAIVADVAEGLEALWSAGMVHRDVKPGNILLDRSGTAYVTDFGLAKNTQGSVLTLPGQALGSLDYMAPEQIRGDNVTGAADLYSLGCVVYECVDGRPPFADRRGMRVLWAHLQDEPADPTSPGLSREFIDALKSALRKEPEDRPASCRAYAEMLSRTVGMRLAA